MSDLMRVGSASHIRTFDMLPGELSDGIAEAVATPPDPHARSAAICLLVREIYETMEWLHGTDARNEELASLRRLVAEAEEHQSRMSSRHDAREDARAGDER